MQKKAHKLGGNHELPFVLIAISCSESLLKTAWNINKTLEIYLHDSEIQLISKDNSDQTFPIFCDRDTSNLQSYSLIPNKFSTNLLVKELPNIDYILEVIGEVNKNSINSIIKRIKQIPGIVVALEVNPSTIKRKSAFNPL